MGRSTRIQRETNRQVTPHPFGPALCIILYGVLQECSFFLQNGCHLRFHVNFKSIDLIEETLLYKTGKCAVQDLSGRSMARIFIVSCSAPTSPARIAPRNVDWSSVMLLAVSVAGVTHVIPYGHLAFPMTVLPCFLILHSVLPYHQSSWETGGSHIGCYQSQWLLCSQIASVSPLHRASPHHFPGLCIRCLASHIYMATTVLRSAMRHVCANFSGSTSNTFGTIQKPDPTIICSHSVPHSLKGPPAVLPPSPIYALLCSRQKVYDRPDTQCCRCCQPADGTFISQPYQVTLPFTSARFFLNRPVYGDKVDIFIHEVTSGSWKDIKG
ncbi:hypothetical protein GDO78_019308 [Eleutherodactylus coqui]|uniref:Uncharacterized protein n=1 Tax=Eleutherodactylus coqui TaxID=57060 RepID=A0A8J6EN90_ELECQ|nr:hypothetical protein GDO78_019308 [Eleutherodactylus coqui]